MQGWKTRVFENVFFRFLGFKSFFLYRHTCVPHGPVVTPNETLQLEASGAGACSCVYDMVPKNS